MRKPEWIGHLWRKAPAGLRLGPWLLLSLLLVLALTQSQPTALAGLFQSPPGPAEGTEATPGVMPAVTGTPVDAPSVEEDTPSGPLQRYAESESDLEFEWSMLFDAVALGLSYVWLFCGGLIVLGVPLFFLVLWIASIRRRRTE